MRLTLTSGALLLLVCPVPLLAQDGAQVAFAPVTQAPVPVQSASGMFSSLSPPNQRNCPYKEVSGRVVSPRLIMVKEMFCRGPGHDNVLVNVQFRNAADAAQMVTGRQVAITARFKSAEEDRDPLFYAEFLIAEKAELMAEDPRDHPASPAPAFTSYMMCQAPELDALAGRLGNELCVQSTIVENITAAGPALETAVRAPANASPDDMAPGDPEAISCRHDRGVSDRHLPAIACARNSYWAWYQAKWPAPWSSTPAPP